MQRFTPYALALVCALSGVTGANAEAPGGLAALGLSGADGTVRAQANVRLAVAVAPGSPDFAVRMSEPVRQQMGSIRTCFGQAMGRSASVQGRAVFEIEALSQGRSRTRVTSNRTGDQEMVECMRASLSQVGFQGIPRGVRSLITLDLTNPSAQNQLTAKTQDAAPSPVKVLPGGRAESEGGTQQGEVQFRISGAAENRTAIENLHNDVSQRFAGLLDCRRKSSRKNHPATGTITLKLSIENGKVAKMRSKADRSVGYKAPGCVMEWLGRADSSRLRPAELELAITFGKD
ncbi:MAG: hypothetical protein QM778_03735 [Myxococcales bacterium]